MKEQLKKLVAFVTSALMALALVPGIALAAGDGSITVENPVEKESYSVYKVFDATYSGSGESKNVAYTYDGSNPTFLTALQSENSPFAVTQQGNGSTYNVSLKEGKAAADVVTFLNAQKANLGTPTTKTAASANLTDGKLVFSNLGYGYYYVTTTTGSAVTIDSAAKDVTVQEKNSVPSVDKKQSATEGNYTDNELDLSIGDTVYYETTITAGKTNDKAITLTDTMSDGLTLNSGSIVVKNGTTTLTQDGQYTLSTTPGVGESYSFKVVLNDTYVQSLKEGDKVVVTYNATLNSSAVIDGDNTNTATLAYSNQTSSDSVKVKTHDFGLTKTFTNNGSKVENNDLKASFELRTSADNASTAVKFASDTTGYYVSSTGSATISASNDSKVNVRGLKAGDYYLVETGTEDGYTKLASAIKVTVANDGRVTLGSGSLDKDSSDSFTVENKAGQALPTTGGMGTTLFTVVGAALVVAAGVLLVTRRRMQQ